MSRIHSISKPHNIPTERVDSFKYKDRPSLGRETLPSRGTLLYWYHDRIIVSRPNSVMSSHCEWYQQTRHRNVRRNTHWDRWSVHPHSETSGKGQAKTQTCCEFVFQFSFHQWKKMDRRDTQPFDHSCFEVSKLMTSTMRHETSIPREIDGGIKFEDLIETLKVKFPDTLQWTVSTWVKSVTRRRGFNTASILTHPMKSSTS